MANVMHINNIPLSDFGAEMLLEHTIGGNSLENTEFTTRNRTTPKLMSRQIGSKAFVLRVDFYGTSRERAQNKSRFDSECIKDTVVLSVDDGYEYHVICTGLGNENPGLVSTEAEYSFTGFRKKQLVRLTANTLVCKSNIPRTDCILSVTVGNSTAQYRLWNANFLNVNAGDKIVFDGIDCRILINGSPRAARCKWIDFPYLVPGVNNIICSDPVTVEYYPTFM